MREEILQTHEEDYEKFLVVVIGLAERAASGEDVLDKGAVGYNGYGFVFIDRNYVPQALKVLHSSRAFGVGSMRNFEAIMEQKIIPLVDERNLKSIFDIANYLPHDREFDFRLMGSLKTLMPELKLGGWTFFELWLFIITPDGKKFPVYFYYYRNSLSIGAWETYRDFPKRFLDYVNFTPFDFNEEDRELFLEALELALLRLPSSEFEGVSLTEDFGDYLIGVKDGKMFERRLDNFIYTWSYTIGGNNQAWKWTSEIVNIVNYYKYLDEHGKVSQFSDLTNKALRELLEWAFNKRSRFAYILLSYNIMRWGVPMPLKLKKLALHYSKWKFERKQFEDKKDRSERRKYLLDFRVKLLTYNNRKTDFPFIPDTGIFRQNIDYNIV